MLKIPTSLVGALILLFSISIVVGLPVNDQANKILGNYSIYIMTGVPASNFVENTEIIGYQIDAERYFDGSTIHIRGKMTNETIISLVPKMERIVRQLKEQGCEDIEAYIPQMAVIGTLDGIKFSGDNDSFVFTSENYYIGEVYREGTDEWINVSAGRDSGLDAIVARYPGLIAQESYQGQLLSPNRSHFSRLVFATDIGNVTKTTTTKLKQLSLDNKLKTSF